MAKIKLTEKVDKKKALKEFKPSTGDEYYLQGSRWNEIRTKYRLAKNQALAAVIVFIEMGELLLTIRETYPGDLQFGKARKEHAPEITRQDAHRAMAMAKNRERFKFGGEKNIPSLSVLSELVNASDELVAEVIDETGAGAKTTVKETRARIKKEKVRDALDQEYFDKGITTVREFEESVIDAPATDVEKLESVTDVDQVQQILALNHQGRIKKIKKKKLDIYTAFLIIGINPLYDGDLPMSHETWQIIYNSFLASSFNVIINDAVTLIQQELYSK